ncbi:CLIP domain-containing serine protease 14D-like [Penaeus japonicus]|uniref:CLIP domain-containing serine protease 14D-like n=1 Tax=Penaeus japonicus TaxID=27405 RepID=UPI001C714804|nr:CLIP domain-containing serine protease 14D-like [Penaeus japonicus]
MDTRRGGVAGIITAVLLVVAQQVSSQGADCVRSQCISIRQCPALLQLLKNPTRTNIRDLQKATCFVRDREPMVCCPSTSTTETPISPTKSLLPESCGHSSHLNRIIGGEVAPLDAYPWKAVLGYKEIGFSGTEFLCGGSVISERYVLTAAHCVDPGTLGARSLEVVRLGEWDLTTAEDCETTVGGGTFCAPPVQDFQPEEIIPHPSYNTRVRFSDDIALIRLNRPINFQESAGFVLPVCLPPADFSPRTVPSTKFAIAAGWGFTENGTSSNRIKHVNLPLVDNSKCNEIYRGTTVSEQLCAGGNAGEDSCSGDSGGPLVLSGTFGPPYQQIGVVSYGPVNCGQKGVPGIYTSVSSYRTWIEQNLKP